MPTISRSASEPNLRALTQTARPKTAAPADDSEAHHIARRGSAPAKVDLEPPLPRNSRQPRLELKESPSQDSEAHLRAARSHDEDRFLSPFERMGKALKIATTRLLKTREGVVPVAETSTTNHHDLTSEVARRRTEDRTQALLPQWSAKVRSNFANSEMHLKGQVEQTASPQAYGLKDTLIDLGRYTEAELVLRSALAGNPANLNMHSDLVNALLQGGKPKAQAAIAAARDGLVRFPHHQWGFRTAIVRTQLLMGDIESARAELAPNRGADPVLEAMVERTPEAIERALQLFPDTFRFSAEACKLAELFACLGDEVNFLLFMEKAIQAPVDNGGLMRVALSPFVERNGDRAPWGPLRMLALRTSGEASVPTMQQIEAVCPAITAIESKRALARQGPDATGLRRVGPRDL